MVKLSVCLLLLPLSLFSQSKAEQEVLSLSKKKFDWIIHKNLDSLENVLDDRLQYIHSNGWIETKKEVIEDIASGKLNYTAIDVHSATARIYQQTAVVTGTGKFEVIMNGNPIIIELGYTEVYIQTNGKWLLASRHANRMP